MDKSKVKSEYIGEIPTVISEIQKNPIYKPLGDYITASQMFEEEDEREAAELKSKLQALNDLIGVGIYNDSPIASAYQKVLEIWERIAWVYTKNISLANRKMGEINSIVQEYYILKEKVSSDDKKLKEQVEELKKKNKELEKELLTKKSTDEVEKTINLTDDEFNEKLKKQIKSGRKK